MEASMAGEAIHVRILRYSPEDRTERVDRFDVPHRRGMTVQTMLQYVYENIDPSLAFRNFRCGRGICNACAIKVNGRVLRTCETLVHAGREIDLKPANNRIVKDLVTELD